MEAFSLERSVTFDEDTELVPFVPADTLLSIETTDSCPYPDFLYLVD